jgi:hypothetical protein
MTQDVQALAARPSNRLLGAIFAAVAVLTTLELVVVGLPVERAARITALAGLLIAKVGLVLFGVMRAGENRRAAALMLVALPFAVGVAVILMLETMFRAGVR